HISIPLIITFRTSFGLIDKRPAIIIRVTDDEGNDGYGEVSSLYQPISEPEVFEKSWNFLIDFLPQLIGLKFDLFSDMQLVLSKAPDGFSLAKTGIEGAFYCLLSNRQKISLRKLWGSEKNEVEVGESIGIKDSISIVIDEIKKHLAVGIKRIKIKIKPGHDIEIINDVRNIFPNLFLGADANAAYSFDDVQHLKKLNEFDLKFIEQPFAADDHRSLFELKKLSTIPICLDESIKDLNSCKKFVGSGLCDIVNIKPGRVGGYTEAKAIHDYCFSKGVPLFGGGRLETGIGKITNAQFYSLPGFTLPSDLTPPNQYFAEDIIDYIMPIKNGKIELTENDGLGASVLEEKIEKYKVGQK
ncbi:MAG: o-succinylbenzoate synthase, partial [Patescibacteria group bacterium]